MAHVESSIFVAQPIEKIYSFLNRRESHRRFIPRMTSLEQTSAGVFGQVGTTLSGMLNYFGIQIPVQYEIIQVEPDQKLAMRGQMGTVDFQDGYVLRASGNGTEISFWLDLLPTGWARLLAPFMGIIGKIHAWETLRSLKRELMKSESVSPVRGSQR
jgi:hypothetical protein